MGIQAGGLALCLEYHTILGLIEELIDAARSFPVVSMRLQHLLDLLNNQELSKALLEAFICFINLLLKGECLAKMHEFVFGGNLIAISKRS